MSKSNLAVAEKLYTDEEYLTFEREAEEKHELIDGEIVAMAGASRRHNLIGTNTTVALGVQLRGKGCELYANDMRVRMRKGRYSYPDVVVVCGEPQFADEEFDVLLNPTVVIEVLSKSTRFRDKTIERGDFATLKRCYKLADETMKNAIFVSFLENLNFESSPHGAKAEKLLSPKLTEMLAELNEHWRQIGEWQVAQQEAYYKEAYKNYEESRKK
jgi:hypothetical protein